HHFIRDAYEKKLIQVLKIHTDANVADLLTNEFDVSSTDSAKLVPLGKDSTALETLKKIPPRVTDQAKEIQHLKAQIKKLKKKAKPGRKSAKAKPSVHKDKAFDELADDTLDYMETEYAQDVGRTRKVVSEEKETAGNGVSTEDEKVSTDRSKVSTDRLRVSTDKEEVSTDRPDEGTDDQTKGRSDTPRTPTPTPTTFGDDETIAQVLIIMSQNKERLKEKGVELKDVEETERPRPTSTRS
ncbi:hypothetical protein Tco_1565282, partial [Tanacetum coccineum]